MSELTFDHDWPEWVDPDYPVYDTKLFRWDLIDFFVVHWPGHDNVPDGDIGESTDLPAFLRQMHRNYLRRGYSLGYSSSVDYLGGTWKIRGDTYRASSNAPGEFNWRTFSATMLTDLDGKVTDYAIAAVNDLIAQVHAQRPNLIVTGHGGGNRWYPTVATQCPGPIADLIADGTIGVHRSPPPNPDAPALSLEDDMPRRAGKLHNPGGPGDGGFWIEAGNGKRRHVGSNDDPRPQWQGHEARLLERQGMQDSKSGKIVFTWSEIQPVDEAFLDTYVGRP